MIAPALASALALAAPEAATGISAPSAAAAPAATEGVISYPAAFFADSQAANAWEMLLRLPGFTLDTGDKIRGFEGGGGNALIDGQRPTSKTDPLDELLRRVPVAQIERIDLIRGGAPGIDMQGRPVIANVIRKPGSQPSHRCSAFKWVTVSIDRPRITLAAARGVSARVKRCQLRCRSAVSRLAMAGPASSRLPSRKPPPSR